MGYEGEDQGSVGVSAKLVLVLLFAKRDGLDLCTVHSSLTNQQIEIYFQGY
jgi:hypothetical protein